MTWAWGEVARLAEPAPAAEGAPVAAVYAAWQLDASEQPTLFRSMDQGATWLPLHLPGGAAPLAWADDGGQRVAVATGDYGLPPLMQMVYDVGIRTEFLPPLIFLGVGALTDFRPLLSRPVTFRPSPSQIQISGFPVRVEINRIWFPLGEYSGQ